MKMNVGGSDPTRTGTPSPRGKGAGKGHPLHDGQREGKAGAHAAGAPGRGVRVIGRQAMGRGGGGGGMAGAR